MNDTARYDGELDFVCCTVQYPNSWFLNVAKAKNPDKIFRDWVVLYIDLGILTYKRAKFCPCNASKRGGAYIQDDMDRVGELFEKNNPAFRYPRPPKMLPACPTDGQAEILIEENIPRDYISGIAVGDEEVAGRVYGMLKLYHMERIPLYVAPDVLSVSWNGMARDGRRPEEALCSW